MRNEGILNLSRKSRSRGRSSSQGGLDDDLGFGASSNRWDHINKSFKRGRPSTATRSKDRNDAGSKTFGAARDSIGSAKRDKSFNKELEPIEEDSYSKKRTHSSKK